MGSIANGDGTFFLAGPILFSRGPEQVDSQVILPGWPTPFRSGNSPPIGSRRIVTRNWDGVGRRQEASESTAVMSVTDWGIAFAPWAAANKPS